MDKNNILLTGFMGTGKTTISHELHRITKMEEIDLDAYIVEKMNCSINDIFEKQGETFFFFFYTDCLKEILKKKNIILSCGGGTVLRTKNVDLMRQNGKIVLLTAEPQTIYDRVRNHTERPLLNQNMNVEYIAQLLEKRKSAYFEAADMIICTDGRNTADICQEILMKIEKIFGKI